VITRHDFSDAANAQELHYRNEVQATEEAYSDLDRMLDTIRADGYLDILPYMQRRGIVPSGVGLELGAGQCWLSAQLSQSPFIERVHALDFSEMLLTQIAPRFIEQLGGRPERIRMHLGDFHDLSMFESASLDFVAAHSALHHTNSLDRVLGEAYRVLKPDGLAFALDEPGVPRYITPLTRSHAPEHFGEHERSFGVIENTYPEEVWAEYFRNAGFTVEFIPFFFRRRSTLAKLIRATPLSLLNGLFFWQKIIVARKPSTRVHP
jgi:ubiquinone/menaquinone biosynthesis C-methylase UbiE